MLKDYFKMVTYCLLSGGSNYHFWHSHMWQYRKGNIQVCWAQITLVFGECDMFGKLALKLDTAAEIQRQGSIGALTWEIQWFEMAGFIEVLWVPLTHWPLGDIAIIPNYHNVPIRSTLPNRGTSKRVCKLSLNCSAPTKWKHPSRRLSAGCF